MIKRIAVCNHKGGVGKTSLTTHAAGAIAELGRRVLLVDGDSQGDLSALFLPTPEALRYTVADLFSGAGVLARDVLQPTAYPNISILPADKRLNQVDMTHGYAESPTALALADAVSELADEFDYVLYDCPPRPHLTGFAALVGSDEVIVPVQPSQFSVRSLATLHEEVDLVKRSLNPRLRLRGYLLSLVPTRSATQVKLRQMLTSAFGEELVLGSVVPVMASLDTAINMRKPIVAHAKKSKAAEIIRSLVAEILGGNEHGHRAAAA